MRESGITDLLREIEEFSLELFELKDTVEIAIITSPLAQDLPLDLQHRLQLFLDALQTVTIVLVFASNFEIVFFHGPCHNLIVLMVSIHHDDGGTIALQLMHHFKAILISYLFLSTTNAVLQVLDCCLQFTIFILILCFSGLNCFVFF